jgi:RNA polymerase sigma factor (TIGR02999 family)
MSQDSDPVAGVSILLAEIHSGNESAREQLFQVIYDRLHNMARGQMRQERVDHTLGATALVNEACMRLDGVVETVENKRELFGAASAAMRRVLIDHARKRNADKRQGKLKRQPLDDIVDQFESRLSCSLLDLEPALTRLAVESPRQRDIVELKFFADLTTAEIARQMDCSQSTVESDWRLARAKLFQWLCGNTAEHRD